jgi:hypothetical protein
MSHDPKPRRNDVSEHDTFLWSDQAAEERRPAIVPRLFVREPGWHVHIKGDSDRLLCYAVAPGEETYHRISDGELYLQRGDERICIPCADRLALLSYEPRMLKEPSRGVDRSDYDDQDGYVVLNLD